MRIVITGATGFIGKALCRALHKDYELVALSRNPDKAAKSIPGLAKIVQWDAKSPDSFQQALDCTLAVINLAGENIGSGLWTKSKKAAILQSRLNGFLRQHRRPDSFRRLVTRLRLPCRGLPKNRTHNPADRNPGRQACNPKARSCFRHGRRLDKSSSAPISFLPRLPNRRRKPVAFMDSNRRRCGSNSLYY
ncbi:MAG: NAD-dependent epimerase/dehydratase family protein [Planctomycetota bacterium]